MSIGFQILDADPPAQGVKHAGPSDRKLARLDSTAPAHIFTGMSSVLRELRRHVRRFEPCLPRPAKRPPAGKGWIHEIKHDGFRIMAWRDVDDVRLLSRRGYDLTARFQYATAAMAALPVWSCLIDAEAIACNERGLADFELIRSYRHDHAVTLCGSICLRSTAAICGASRSRSARTGSPTCYAAHIPA